MSVFPARRTAIVTGAVSERGIGRATANYLAAQGWNIGIIDLDDALCKATAKELASRYGVQAHGAGADVADEGSVRGAFAFQPREAASSILRGALPSIAATASMMASIVYGFCTSG